MSADESKSQDQLPRKSVAKMMPAMPVSVTTWDSSKKMHATPWVNTMLHGVDLLRNPKYNKGTAFTADERKAFRLDGLLPPIVLTQDVQVHRVMKAVRGKSDDLERFIYLAALCDRNEKLFYRVMMEFTEELMPIVYTPTVGLACQKFGHIYRRPRGIYITMSDKGRIASLLRNWPTRLVRCIVFTDGERILGLGDLGACGMGIPIGKLALYTACAGVPHSWCLPVCIDTGTNNEAFLADEFYLGTQTKRVRGAAYDELIDEFINAAREVFGEYTLLQFEDFANQNAFRLLAKYRDQCCTFNDDIQGTASVVVAGVYGALPLIKKPIESMTYLFYGAGSAGIGIADLLAEAIVKDSSLTLEQARAQIFLVDSKGLITKDRSVGGLNAEKQRYAHDVPEALLANGGLAGIVRSVKPTAIIGVSAIAGVFDAEVCQEMAKNADMPLICALSNPTSKAECTAEHAYKHTNGKCIFLSGSPFDPVTMTIDGEEKTFTPGQGNNSYIFPGAALGILASGARRVTDSMFLVAAKTLSTLVTPEHYAMGKVYPDLKDIRAVSAAIAAAVAAEAYDLGLAMALPRPDDLLDYVKAMQYNPEYPDFHE